MSALAVAALLLCALGDAAGRRIVPQVRRQVPESWRRILPVPAAAALYGVLLGLGFTTFLLTFATWALAIACLALGTPATGLAVGLAFGAGRAFPVAILATRPDGAAAIAERPDVLRGLRGAVAAALIAAAAVLAVAPPTARAASVLAYNASDPSASAGAVAWHVPGGNGQLRRADGTTVALPGAHPALSGSQVAWIADGTVVIADAATLTPTLTPAPGADAVALSATAVAWRAGNTISAQALAGGEPAVVDAASGLGAPCSTGAASSSTTREGDSRILPSTSTRGPAHAAQRHRGAAARPSLVGGRLMYVRSTYTASASTSAAARSTRPPRPRAATSATRRATTRTTRAIRTGSGRRPIRAPRRPDRHPHRHRLRRRHRLRHPAAPPRLANRDADHPAPVALRQFAACFSSCFSLRSLHQPAHIAAAHGPQVIVDDRGRHVLLRGVNVNPLGDYYQAARPPTTSRRRRRLRRDARPGSTSSASSRLVSLGARPVARSTTATRPRAPDGRWAKAHDIYSHRHAPGRVGQGHRHARGCPVPPGLAPAIGWDGAPGWATTTDGARTCRAAERRSCHRGG